MNENITLESKKVLFCDLDGTLIETISGETFPKGIWDVRIKFDVLDAIKKLNPKYILIVSNQGGIENGFVNADNFRVKSEYITRAIREYCGCECYAMYCETNDKSDPYRKPNTGMLETLLEKYVGDDFDYIKQKSLMIGDASGKEGQFSDSDKKTAENFGIDYMDVNDFVNTLVIEDKKPKNKVRFYVARDRSNNTLYIYLSKPRRDISKFYPSANGSIIAIQDYFYKFGLNEKDFDNLKFEDEPVEVFLNLEN